MCFQGIFGYNSITCLTSLACSPPAGRWLWLHCDWTREVSWMKYLKQKKKKKDADIVPKKLLIYYLFPYCYSSVSCSSQRSDRGGGVDQWKCQQRQRESRAWLLRATHRVRKRSLWKGVCVWLCMLVYTHTHLSPQGALHRLFFPLCWYP